APWRPRRPVHPRRTSLAPPCVPWRILENVLATPRGTRIVAPALSLHGFGRRCPKVDRRERALAGRGTGPLTADGLAGQPAGGPRGRPPKNTAAHQEDEHGSSTRVGQLVGEEGFEPSHPFGHTDLNRARLP